MTTEPAKVAILFSGRGSNMLALADALENELSAGRVATIICNRPDAEGIALAESRGHKVEVLDHKKFANRDAFDDALSALLKNAEADLVCAAGFMRVLGAKFVRAWRDRLINIHPSLLPDFPGLDTHARALSAQKTKSGCSVHFIREGVDTGPVIAQAEVPVRADDTAATLGARVLAREHRLYVFALDLLLNKKVKCVGDEIFLTEPVLAPEYILPPKLPSDNWVDAAQ